MTRKITAAFADYPDIPPDEIDNAVCRSCSVGLGCYDPHFCDVEEYTNLRFAVSCGRAKHRATAYPYDWLEEKVVICQNSHCVMRLGPARDRQRRMKMLYRTEIVERLKSLREKSAGGGPLIDLRIPYSSTMHDFCLALGLCETEVIAAMGSQTMHDLIAYQTTPQPHPPVLSRDEIVEHLKSLRKSIEQEGQLINNLHTSFSSTFYDICRALKLTDNEIIEAMGARAARHFNLLMTTHNEMHTLAGLIEEVAQSKE